MNYPHTIRLRGPWRFEPICRYAGDPPSSETAEGLPPPGRTGVPGDWSGELGSDFRGRVCYRRRFGRPSGLEPHERVWLVVDGADARASVTVNGSLLGSVSGYAVPAEFDLTQLLLDRNELALEVELPAVLAEEQRPGRDGLAGGPLGEVRLEIRHVHFLERPALWATAGSHAEEVGLSGRITGPCGPRLDVLMAVGGRVQWSVDAEGGSKFDGSERAELVRWISGNGETPVRLERVTVGVADAGRLLWEKEFVTAARQITWDAMENRLVVENRSLDLPLPTLPLPTLPLPELPLTESPLAFIDSPVDQLMTPLLAKSPGFLCRSILSDEFYDACDRLGLMLVQSVPPSWAGGVCSRLAHHPSIVAWTWGGAGGISGLPLQWSQGTGRPRLPIDLVAGD